LGSVTELTVTELTKMTLHACGDNTSSLSHLHRIQFVSCPIITHYEPFELDKTASDVGYTLVTDLTPYKNTGKIT